MSLRAIVTSLVLGCGALVLASATLLVVTTTYLHSAATRLGTALDSVRLVEQLEVDLLRHGRLSDPSDLTLDERRARDRSALEMALRRHGADLYRYADNTAERELIRRVEQQIDEYLQPRDAVRPGGIAPEETRRAFDKQLETTFLTAEELVQLNVRQADAMRAEIAGWDRIARAAGVILSLLLVAAVASTLTWLRTYVFRPIFDLSEAVRRFGKGSEAFPAPETGAREIADIGRMFNEMTSSLDRYRRNQLSFLAGVAHDLRNPLHAVKMATHLMSGPPAPSRQRLQRLQSTAARQIDTMERMMDDLLDASRIEAGELELRKVESDMRLLAEDAVELFRPQAPGHNLVLSVPRQAVPLHCDPLRIGQVLNNLVSNAIKYSPDGGRIEIGVSVDGQSAVLAVSDEGIGVAADDRPWIFEPFRRGAVARERIPGVGLGLSVAARLVRAHDGTIEVDSCPGIGSTFRVRLPLGRVAASVHSHVGASSAPAAEPLISLDESCPTGQPQAVSGAQAGGR